MELHGGNGIMLEFGIEKLLRDASLFLHRDATVDISRFKREGDVPRYGGSLRRAGIVKRLPSRGM